MRRPGKTRILIEYAAARLVVASLAWLPRRAAFALAGLYVGLLDKAIPRLRRTAWRNLSMALPDLAEDDRRRIVAGSFRSIARILVAFARFPRISAENVSAWIRYEGFEHYQRAIKDGKGVLFATAHLGNWELSAYSHALMASPMHVVARALDNPRIDALVARYRALSGNRVIEKKDFARGILRALGRNEAVGILIDQNTSLQEGVFVQFFGIPACVHPGLAKLAAHSGAAVIPGFALWSESEGRYVLRFDAPIDISGDAVEDTRRLHAHLEQVIRQHPDQWLWMHRRWKTRPPGEAPLYD